MTPQVLISLHKLIKEGVVTILNMRRDVLKYDKTLLSRKDTTASNYDAVIVELNTSLKLFVLNIYTS